MNSGYGAFRRSGRSFVGLAACLLSVLIFGCVRLSDKHEVESPARQYIASVFTVDPGAMDSYTTIVTLRPRGTPFNRFAGEIFVTRGAYPVKLTWSRDRVLVVECIQCDPKRIEVHNTEWRDVRVEYHGFEQVAKTP